MTLFLRSNLCPYRRAAASVVIVLAAIASGCGSSDPANGNAAGKSPKQLLKDEQLYTYEGSGSAKRKVPIDRRERVKLLREARQAE